MRFRPIAFRGTPAQQRFRMCERKRRYGSQREAEHGNKDRVYRCPHCGFWHRTQEPRLP